MERPKTAEGKAARFELRPCGLDRYDVFKLGNYTEKTEYGLKTTITRRLIAENVTRSKANVVVHNASRPSIYL